MGRPKRSSGGGGQKSKQKIAAGSGKPVPIPKELFRMRDSFLKARKTEAHESDAILNTILMKRRNDLISHGIRPPKRASRFASNSQLLRDSLWPEIRMRGLTRNLPIPLTHEPPYIPKPDMSDCGLDEKILAHLEVVSGIHDDLEDVTEEEKKYSVFVATSQKEGSIEMGLAIGHFCSFSYDPPHECDIFPGDEGPIYMNTCEAHGYIFDYFKVESEQAKRLVTIDAYLYIPKVASTLVVNCPGCRIAKVRGEVSLSVACAGADTLATSPFTFYIAGTAPGHDDYATDQPQTVLSTSAILNPGQTLIGVAIDVRLSAMLGSDKDEIGSGCAAIDLTVPIPSGPNLGVLHSKIIPWYPVPAGPIRVEKITCMLEPIA